MSKIMVVEDDASLREIYGIRVAAEGYEVVSAGDGEEALAVAVREKPDLILLDIMMPKISGFDMLDILRSTPEISHIKVVVMTALSADDQRQRGERLGADRYLVKSQVGIEDVVKTIHEVLGDNATAAAAPDAPASVPESQATAPVEQQAVVPAEPALAAAPAEPTPVEPPTELAAASVEPTAEIQAAPADPAPQPQVGYEQPTNPTQ